jgi:four helix bundle protein
MHGRTFRDLDTWQSGMDLAVAIYAVAAALPSNERFELSNQMRRAAVSVPSNVAEGYAHRQTPKTYARHVRISLGSVAELDTALDLAVRVGLLRRTQISTAMEHLIRSGQLLHGLLRSIRKQIAARSAVDRRRS